MDKMDELRERVQRFHEEVGTSYKVIAQTLGISTSVMYNFTSGIRGLRVHVAELLDDYLKEQNY